MNHRWALTLTLLAGAALAGPRGLQLDWDKEAGLTVDGKKAPLGGSVEALTAVIGKPTWTKVNPPDKSAMSDTTYLFYSERGMAVRTKANVVEGFYIYFDPIELEGHKATPAKLALPKGLTQTSTLDQVIKALGEPSKREPFDLMKWMDVVYNRGNTATKFHFDKGAFNSVSIELIDVRELSEKIKKQ